MLVLAASVLLGKCFSDENFTGNHYRLGPVAQFVALHGVQNLEPILRRVYLRPEDDRTG